MSEGQLLHLDFGRADLPLLRHLVAECLLRAGVNDRARRTFLQAALEIACNTVIHGGGSGNLVVRLADGTLRCEVTDQGAGPHRLLSPGPPTGGNHGLWLAEALTGRLELRAGPGGPGTTAAVAVRLEDLSN
ncbi:ATP-binding protein [Kutzneria sp. CA-103260]|uniref:ATP-binding protein n=1 Tax=Kutzneria sp. CA-103260 TaxID=2802641 RepID=UPI001BA7D39E|nr:ATP-binding protein [Kutzneria sp. CA-103260]QUQ66656.1 Histidine kinase-like ATPase domain protein [Kutzneria sp. CA-103260]